MTEPQREGRRSNLALRPVLLALGVGHLALGAVMLSAPQAFFDGFASFEPYNDHFIRDISTVYLALGAAFLIAGARRSWQVPVLGLALIQYVLHSLNHVWDVSDTDPSWMGPANLVTLLLVTGLLWWALRTAQE